MSFRVPANKIPHVIVIAGPTAIGKTATAIQLAKALNTVILSADSRQCFKEMNIGVARPSEEELKAVPHYFIATHSIQDEMSAGIYETYALQQLAQLFQTHPVVIVCGGTGLYLKALLEGMDPIPEIAENIRTGIINTYNNKGVEWLQQQLEWKDPLFASKGEMKNPQRMMRALEVITATGKSILTFQQKSKTDRPFTATRIMLTLPKEQLYARINQRVPGMMDAGLTEEVRSLLPYRSLNALQTVGYRELFAYFDGSTTLKQAIEQIQTNTRHYAKRQLTWFKKQGFYPVDVSLGDPLPEILQQVFSATNYNR